MRPRPPGQTLNNPHPHGLRPPLCVQTNVAAEAVGFLPNLLSAGMGWAAQVQDMASAQAQLAREPLFCLETCCKLFHWTRLACARPPWPGVGRGALPAVPGARRRHAADAAVPVPPSSCPEQTGTTLRVTRM